MDLALLVYAISLLKPLNDALGVVNICITLLVCLGLFFALINAVNHWKWFKSKLVWMVVTFCVVGTIKIFIPEEKTAYMMVGAYTAQKIAQDPKTAQIGARILTILNQKLDLYIAEGLEQAEKATEKKGSK